MGIYYGITEESEKEKAFKVLLDIIKQDDYHIATGVLGGRVLFHLLAENGEIDTAIRILKNPTPPSYMQWVQNGDTALCEGFGEYDGLSSHNHHFWGNISAFFMQQICGIKVGADTINIEPHIPSGMNNACATYRSVYGAVSVNWKKEGNAASFDIKCPKNLKGVFKFGSYTCPVSEINAPLQFTIKYD